MNAIFYRTEEQKKLAEASLLQAAKKRAIEPAKVVTKILPATPFTYAEDYHQKYRLRRFAEIAEELERIYPNFIDLTNSTVATRLNAYVAGEGDRAALEAEIGLYGLSERAQKTVLSLVPKR